MMKTTVFGDECFNDNVNVTQEEEITFLGGNLTLFLIEIILFILMLSCSKY